MPRHAWSICDGEFLGRAPMQYRASLDLEQYLDLIRELMMRMDVPVTLTVLDDVICARYLGMMFGNVTMLLLPSERN